MGCQTEIAARIRKKQAGYILAVKDNQATLHEDIWEYFAGLENGDIRDLPNDLWETELEKGHGRIEKREVRLVSTIRRLAGKEKWKDIKTIIQYRAHRTVNETTVQTGRYYISSSDMNADEMYRYLRGHPADRKPAALEFGRGGSGRRGTGEEGSRAGKPEYPENGSVIVITGYPVPEKHIPV